MSATLRRCVERSAGEPDDLEETEDTDICPLCNGVWVDCGCDPRQADAAYTEGAA